jgi:hypothetical protein
VPPLVSGAITHSVRRTSSASSSGTSGVIAQRQARYVGGSTRSISIANRPSVGQSNQPWKPARISIGAVPPHQARSSSASPNARQTRSGSALKCHVRLMPRSHGSVASSAVSSPSSWIQPSTLSRRERADVKPVSRRRSVVPPRALGSSVHSTTSATPSKTGSADGAQRQTRRRSGSNASIRTAKRG